MALMTRARVERYDWICVTCTNRQRDEDPARYMTRRLASMLKRRGFCGPYPGTPFVRQVIARCGGKSVISGNRSDKLCVILLNDHGDWKDPSNGILVTLAESRALGVCKSQRQDMVDFLRIEMKSCLV
jgi:hypothetical protein